MKQQKMEVNKDLLYERSRCTFDPVEVTYFFDGSAEETKERRNLEQHFLNALELKENVAMKYKSHKEKYEDSLRIACNVFHKVRELQRSGTENIDLLSNIFEGRLGSALFQDGNPLLVHYAMFLPALMGQANSEQQAYWISRAWDGDVIGTYAQTELGHGTFLRGLETTATYDPETKEFVLNSPNLTSYKWWPGGCKYIVIV
ncbi:probable peroxisomal acyl-coenzyme A oxidase 1 [Bombus pyrosoma]|uniref:probable peroxisomal acyl-coenzyme A oxidase 1 n=1 Tax=Bombus pyrosoma TaxID=396416 RepID=UPI001CB94646|nr:probable peroxisomal acyl-coenzyme A oxidase 1 [Bombus pyrosoma]